MKKTLLLIDLQNDFCNGGALAVPDGDAVIAVANRAMATCRQRGMPVAASLDWHPADHRSFAVNVGEKVGTSGMLDDLPQTWWPVHCVQNSHGAKLHPELEKHGIQRLIYKGVHTNIDSYSAFYDNGHRSQTELDAWLRAQDIHALIVMGLATDYCVKYTVLDALKLGYSVEVLADGCRGVDLAPGDSQRALEEMRRQGAKLITLSDLA